MGELTLLQTVGLAVLVFILFIASVAQAARTWTWESLKTQKRFVFEEEKNG